MTRQIQLCIGAIFFFASWTHAYSIGAHATIPNILVGTCLALFFIDKAGAREVPVLQTRPEDLSLLLFMLITIISCIVSSNSKSVNYLIAYIFSFVVFAIVVREIIIEYGSSAALLAANVAGMVFVSMFAIAEFFLNVFLQFDVQDHVMRTTPAHATYFIFPRVYGFSEEPTYLAWYFNTLGPVGLVYLWASSTVGVVLRIFFTLLVVCAYLLTFSAAGFVFLSTATVVAGVSQLIRNYSFQIRKNINRRAATRFGAIVSVVLILGLFASAPDDVPVREFFDGLVQKVTLSQSEVGDRAPLWAADLDTALSEPLFGHGPGYLSSVNQGSSLNLFIFVAVEQGVIASAALLLFYLSVGMRIWMAEIPYKKAVLTGYCAGVFHLLTMTQHYHPCLWLLIALAYLLRKETGRHPIVAR